jgi:hypothetical protein
MRLGRLIVLACAFVTLAFRIPVFGQSQAPYEFEMNPSVRAVLPDDSIKELQAALEQLRAATSVLQADPHANQEQLAHASDLSRRAMGSIESRSLTLRIDDPLALFWTDLLADGWFVTGWASFESGDLASAESYLRASWRLSHDKSSGLQLARVLEAKGDKSMAAHVLELASVAAIDNPMGLMGSSFPASDDIAREYSHLTGHAPPDSRDKLKELKVELDQQSGDPTFIRSTKLDGSAIFLVSIGSEGPTKAIWYLDDDALAPAASSLEAHSFEPVFPIGSKAKLLREVYVNCSPGKGCTAFLRTPAVIDFPGSRVNWSIFSPNSAIHFKSVNVRLE